MVGRDVKLGVVGAKMLGDGGGVLRFIELALVEADREAAHGAPALRLHQRHDGRGIDAARQKRAERHVRHHAPPDRVAQQRIEPLLGLFFRETVARRLARARDLLERPEGLDPRLARAAHGEDRAWLKFMDAAIDRARPRHVAEAQIGGERIAVELGRPARIGAERLQLGAEQEAAVEFAPNRAA